MKNSREPNWGRLFDAVILGVLGWVCTTLIDLGKKVAILDNRVLGVAAQVERHVFNHEPSFEARFGFPLPNLEKRK
jgi:hypothetical protein